MATAGKKQWRRAMREVVRWRRWGVEAIIGEGWRGHVLCTFSLLSCSRNIVCLLCWVVITQPLVHTACKFSKSCPHEITCTHINTRRSVFHPLENASLTCILRKRTGATTLHLSERRICQILPIFGAATFFLTSLLPPRRPSSERHQAAIATGRLWETEIRSLQTRGSRN